MKKIIVLIAALMAIATLSKAQDNTTDFRNKLQIGFKAGLNLSNVYDTKGDQFNADSKFGFAAGAFASIPIGTYLGLQPEILFSQKGFSATGSVLGLNYTFTRTLNYVDVPVFFALKPSEFFTLLAGPQYSFLLNQKDKFTSSAINSDQEQDFSSNSLRKNTICFVLGGDITMKHIVVGVRAGWDLFNNNGDGTSTNPRYKNVWYQTTLGFRF